MDKKAILKVAAHLDAVPPEVFDMDSWAAGGGEYGFDDDGKRRLLLTIADVGIARAVTCGMTACLGGHAALALPDRLRLRTACGGQTVSLVALPFDDDAPYDAERRTGHLAISLAFDVCEECAYVLTLPGAAHDTAAKAARVLRRMVEGRPWYESHDDDDGRSLISFPRYCRTGVEDCRVASDDDNDKARSMR